MWLIDRLMAHFHSDDLEYVGDDYYDVVDFDDNPFGEPEVDRDSDLDSVDSDFEDDFELVRIIVRLIKHNCVVKCVISLELEL